MKVSRRHFLGTSTATLASLKFVKAGFGIVQKGEFKIGMCDWNLGSACDPEMIPKAREASLMGLQVSVGTAPDNIPLREPSIRSRYLEMGKQHGIVFHSVAAGGILNDIPLKSEPQSAVYVIDGWIDTAFGKWSDRLLASYESVAKNKVTVQRYAAESSIPQSRAVSRLAEGRRPFEDFR